MVKNAGDHVWDLREQPPHFVETIPDIVDLRIDLLHDIHGGRPDLSADEVLRSTLQDLMNHDSTRAGYTHRISPELAGQLV
jgi:hypothetical protein